MRDTLWFTLVLPEHPVGRTIAAPACCEMEPHVLRSPGIHLSFANMFPGSSPACCDGYQDPYSTAACSRCMDECTDAQCCLVLPDVLGATAITHTRLKEIFAESCCDGSSLRSRCTSGSLFTDKLGYGCEAVAHEVEICSGSPSCSVRRELLLVLSPDVCSESRMYLSRCRAGNMRP